MFRYVVIVVSMLLSSVLVSWLCVWNSFGNLSMFVVKMIGVLSRNENFVVFFVVSLVVLLVIIVSLLCEKFGISVLICVRFMKNVCLNVIFLGG